ncbi:MAG: hypothetical protein ABIT69_09655 [Sphingomicrobium sp.]
MAGLSIGIAWEETKAFIARDKRLLVPLALGLIVVPGAFLGLVAPGAQMGTQDKNVTAMILTIAAAVIGLIAQLTVIKLALGFSGSLGDAIRLAVQRVGVLLLAMAILVLPVALLTMVIGGVVEANGGAAAASAPKGIAAILLLVVIAVFMWLAVRLLLVSVVVMAEKLGPIGLLKRSFDLTRGQFWRLFAFVLLLFAALLALVVAVGAVGAALVTAVFGPPDAMTVGALIVGLLSGLVQAGVGVVYAAMLARLYPQLSAAPANA